jgi:hypothetical protein
VPGRTFLFEFEYSVCDFEQVDVLAPNSLPTILDKITRRISRSIFNSTGKKLFVNTSSNQLVLDKDYDLFLFICQFSWELYYLDYYIKDWRKKCRKAVCWLDEIWAKNVPKFKYELSVLKDFDHIFMNFNSSIKKVADVIQRPCSYMPPGIDAIKFCPYPLQSQKSIDVCGIGRCPTLIHESLLNLANQNNFFYIYDTLKLSNIINYNEHRSWYRNIVKRSRYFIAYKPKFDLVSETGGQEELSVRFFEAAAGGAVILGIPPNCEAFSQNFDWSDAVIPLPENTPNVAELIFQLDSQPERLNKIRTDNVVNSLLRHDWVYRWGQILDTVGLSHTPKMAQRRAYLRYLANMVLQKSS